MNSKYLHMTAMTLLWVGGLNWGLVGLLDINLVTMLLGDGTMLTKIVYILVGLSTVWIIITHKKDCRICNPG
ncbi:MAG: hypothetical protein ACD_30C00022G0008 [uncultured bacterium]|uniref:DUF378 domain-containing protein n=2 Tax=Candidatus Daviesiibacteriota TaxID=1752718 RepID=A0A0G0H7J1_9BACT|nr:MAG: hypothetical protein ACD_30C00022G0008 [uncultured bacterium]KKQ08064.1 MAG: hypothetical protein US19_C0032G0008 [Candidatus Daviesbacteria bacterium GW2011_GWB1_36_5]OGE33125.1 MAG: hypothetical protein A3C99_03810 [Candidatus Daviesbacteria bacterium RIFCSPHIGHO2_02_FULL_37_9]OGE36723.1 MAG: hypothetical protein A3E66_02210 [Candidatus Daviesbacteria bacterium RIFCSPHIGHO2_12_FULL_37_16]